MSDENKERITQFFVACSRAITTAYRIDIDRAMALLQVLKERHVSFADNPRWSFTVETLESMDSLIPKRGEPTSRVSTQSSVPEDEQPDLNENFFGGDQGSISNNQDEVPETDPVSNREEVSCSGEGSLEEDADKEVIPDYKKDDNDEEEEEEDEEEEEEEEEDKEDKEDKEDEDEDEDEDFIPEDESSSDESFGSDKLAHDFLTDEEDGMNCDDLESQQFIDDIPEATIWVVCLAALDFSDKHPLIAQSGLHLGRRLGDPSQHKQRAHIKQALDLLTLVSKEKGEYSQQAHGWLGLLLGSNVE